LVPAHQQYVPLQIGALEILEAGQLTSDPHNTASYVILAVVALAVIAMSAVVALESSYVPRTMSAVAGIGRKCNTLEMYYGRNNASFWVAHATPGRNPALIIRPADDEAFRQCPGLAAASFVVTVRYGNESHVLLDPPSQLELGVYRYESFPPPRLPTIGPTELEVRLDFGFYPGGDSGQPCDDTACMPLDVAHTGTAFSGDEIRSETGERVRLAHGPRAVGRSADTSTCSTLDPLPAVYMATENDFVFTDEEGMPCNVVAAGSALPATPDLRWIQVLGDSNSRYLVTRLAEMLNLTLAAEHTAVNEKHPTTLIFHDGTGSGVVLSFQWFFVRQDPSDARNLAAINLSSLAAYLDSIPFAPTPAWPKSFTATETRVTDLFLSFGSHAPGLTQSGMRAGMDRLDAGLRERFGLARSTYLLLTAATEPSTIPESYGPQSAMRNNMIIKNAQNAVANEYIRSTFPDTIVVDFFSLTRTTPLSLKKDSVHFLSEVYSAQADLMWTAMHLADLRVEPPSLP
jgi:hypothetical protein